ncbi:MAG: DUF3883 domain-containing protein [Rhizobiaceae bacterium]
MIRIDNLAIYNSALGFLDQFKGHAYLGRLVQIFIAAKYYGHSMPVVGDPAGLNSGTLQDMLDDLYEKPSLGPTRIAIIFNNNHLAPTGTIAPGLASPSNIWRNNFNLQKGFGCYAPAADLLNAAFRNQSRTLCPHMLPAVPGQLNGAHCSIDPQGTYRREDHAKVFRIDPVDRTLFIYDPGDVAFYSNFVLNSQGRRIPIGPLIVALYFDSIVAAGRFQVDLSEFLVDFGFTPGEFGAYFDDDPVTVENAQLSAMYPGAITWNRINPAAAPPPIGGVVPAKPKPATPATPATAPNIAPPANSFWWDAEQAVRLLLEGAGWTVTDNSRLNLGYDLLARRAGETIMVEVKSSAGRCSPVLTNNEYSQACAARSQYVLAVVENFSPTSALAVKWVRDPARLSFTRRTAAVFALPRSQWVPSSALRP